jgi:hypothetical protein
MELNYDLAKHVQLLIDNRFAINLAKNLVSHDRSKHIETRFHFIREQVVNGRVEVMRCHTKDQLADGFTKGAIKLNIFEALREGLGIVCVERLWIREVYCCIIHNYLFVCYN